MNPVIQTLVLARDRLVQVGKPFALVGGLAVSSRVEPRFTRDVDLAVSVFDDAEAEALAGEFIAQGFRVVASVEQTATSRLATLRLVAPAQNKRGIVVDLLFASSGIEAEVAAAAEPLEVFPSVVVPVARMAHLIALKLLARDDNRRPQDALDLRALIAAADEAERQAVEPALRLITERGYARKRDLLRAYREMLRVP